jgi:hypothetical protein
MNGNLSNQQSRVRFEGISRLNFGVVEFMKFVPHLLRLLKSSIWVLTSEVTLSIIRPIALLFLAFQSIHQGFSAVAVVVVNPSAFDVKIAEVLEVLPPLH